MMKIGLIKYALNAAVLVLLLSSSIVGQAKIKKPNIVLILADDMGYHLSAIGTPGLKTPHIDGLVSQGTLFTEALSSCASCSPSRSSILTGMYPHSNGHWRNTFGPRLEDSDEYFTTSSGKADIVGVHDWVHTLPELMNKSGYYTAIMRKFHLSFPYKYPFSGRYPTNTNRDGYFGDVQQIIRDAGKKPFFIQANISPPHRPFKKQAMQYKGEWPDQNQLEVFPYLPDMDEVREDLLYYYVSVMLTDQITGEVLRALKDAGVEEETLIIFTSDHGPAFHRSKASAYYAGAHVPLIIKGKHLQKGKSNKELVSLTDILPTMLDYVGMEIPEQVQGQSLLPILKQGKDELTGRNYVFTTHNSHGPVWEEFYPGRAIYDGRYYLIRNLYPGKTYLLPADLYMSGQPWGNLSYPAIKTQRDRFPVFYKSLIELEQNRPPFELYDMLNDPGQMNNLYGKPNYEMIRVNLEEELANWQFATGDTIMEDMIQSFKRKTRSPKGIKEKDYK